MYANQPTLGEKLFQLEDNPTVYNGFNYSIQILTSVNDGTSTRYVPMRPCVVPQSKGTEGIAVGKIAKWPERLHAVSERLKLVGKKERDFKEDSKLWVDRVRHYKNLWTQELKSEQIRNVMDMYTTFGGYGAALIKDPVWVMNVVSSYAANTLGVVYDRGLIGTVHDW